MHHPLLHATQILPFPRRVPGFLPLSLPSVAKMRACTVPSAAVLFCPAMLLLLTLLATVPTTTALAVNTTTPCAPAWCGGLNITYPFWLDGIHSHECGHQAFEVACDKQGRAFLKNSIWTYQILDIFYNNNSFRIMNLQLVDGTCDIELYVNASSDLGLTPFKISPRNQELFFLYDCHWQARQLPPSWAPVSCASSGDSINPFAWISGKYRPDANLTPLPGNCTVSVMPVLGYERATGADYQRLMEGGFLLEYTAGDCETCKETGGQCRIDNTVDLFECHCSDGVHLFSCDDLIYG